MAMAVANPWLGRFSLDKIPRATITAKNKVTAIEIFHADDHESQLLNEGP